MVLAVEVAGVARLHSLSVFFFFLCVCVFFFFQAEDGIRDVAVTGVQTCALPIYGRLQHVLKPHLVAHPSRGHLDRVPGLLPVHQPDVDRNPRDG